MLVRDVMTKGAECVCPSNSLYGAAQKMKNLDVGPLPVCGDNDRLVGMLTDRDITVRAVAQACDPRTTTVKDVMTPDVVYCFDDQDVQEAARLMKEHQAVGDRQGRRGVVARPQAGEAVRSTCGSSPDGSGGWDMRRLLPDPVVGAMAGFALGFFAAFPLGSLGVDVSGWPAIGLGIGGAIVGGVVGVFLQGPVGRARTVARWSVAGAAALGGVAFLAGFVGPMVLHPDWPQGPTLGIFFTGPLGALAGAVVGAMIGLLVPAAPTQHLPYSRPRPGGTG